MKHIRPGTGPEHPKARRIIADLLCDLAGGVLYAVGIYTFAEQGGFAPGGISGLALLAHHLWGWPVGLTAALLNLPLILISLKFVGKRFLLRSARTVLLCTLILDGIAPLTPAFTGSQLLAALLSGTFLGAGMAIFYRRGSSSGGTDLLSVTVHAIWPRISLGAVTLVTDLLIIGAGWAVFGGTRALVCGLLATVVNAVVIDAIVGR